MSTIKLSDIDFTILRTEPAVFAYKAATVQVFHTYSKSWNASSSP